MKNIKETIEELFRLAHIEYSAQDAIANNPPPEEEAEAILKNLLYQQTQEILGEIGKMEPHIKPLGKLDGDATKYFEFGYNQAKFDIIYNLTK